jgi:HD-GYP domain-containing protein (c-di-GMP phosphodiesterase class II)
VGDRQERGLRLGELIAALSLAFDLGNNFPLEKALRNALLAVGLGREIGLAGEELSDVYYVAQLRYLGCTAASYELADFLGVDELAGRSTYAAIATSDPIGALKATVTRLGRGAGPVPRARAVLRMAVSGKRVLGGLYAADCEAAERLASRLGLSTTVCSALHHVHSSWDGKGVVGRVAAGEGLAMAGRIAFFVHVTEIHHRLGGRDAAIEVVRRRAGSDFDPQLAAAFLRKAPELLAEIEQESVWDAALSAEPQPRPWIPSSRLDAVAQAFGDFADLKSPYTLGHSAGVAALAAAAGPILGLGRDDVAMARRAGWLHDLGRVSVPNTIWDKPGRLTSSEWERVRLHPYYTERILSRSPLLQPLSLAAGMHHERLDGSGYHRGVSHAMIPVGARLLAAADVYQAMTEERPYRPAMPAAAAGRELKAEAEAGRLDREAVKAVLEATGQRTVGQRLSWPNDLSEREVQVLRLAARGKPNREIASLLHISENTVHHHVKRIYDKIEVSTRAGAALFAMEHDLIRSQGPKDYPNG